MNVKKIHFYGNNPREVLTVSNNEKAVTIEENLPMAQAVRELNNGGLLLNELTDDQVKELISIFGNTAEDAKVLVSQQAKDYYDQVGYTFSYSNIPLSVDYDTRGRLRIRLQAEKAAGKETTTLWYSSHRFDLPITATEQMLSALELYAAACFDTKNQHLANIAKLESVEKVVNYDYTANYPEQLKF